MAERKPLFIATEGFSEEMAQSDTATFGGLTLGGDIGMGGNKVTGAAAATASGELLSWGQVGAELSDLTINPGNDITLSGGGEVVGLPGTPSGDTAAASKAYVDSVAQGLDVHESVRAATTSPATLSTDFENGDAIDNVTLATNDRILIKNQASGVENGIYIVQASGAPVRATDWQTGYEAAGAFVFVEEGDSNADSGWVCTNDNAADTTGTDALTFSQFSGAGQITAGDGLTKTGNILDVGAGNGIAVAADSVAVNADVTTASTTEANAISVTANGVSIKVDDSSIEGSLQGVGGTESLRVKDGGITSAKLDPDIDITTTGDIQTTNGTITASGNITSTNGIFTGDGSGLTNLPSAASTDAVTISCKKSTAGTISVGSAVHLVGFSSPNYTVELADADTASLMPAIGVVTSTVTDSIAGTVVMFGKATGLDTTGGGESWSAGDSLYVSTTAGNLTNVKPTGSGNLIQRIGEVASVNASTGIIQVQGAGRTNDLPNIAQNNFWAGNASGVPIATPAGDGIAITAGSEIQVDITPDIGLHFNTGKLEIELDNTPDTLDADSNGLKVVGLPSQFKINDVQVGAGVTAANLDTLTDGSNADALHVHAAAPATEAPRVENTLTTATDATSDGDPVYINGTNTIGKADASDNAKSRVIGMIRTGSGAAGATPEVVTVGPCAGVLSGATPNTRYFLAAGGGLSASAPAGGNRIISMGYALNATDLFVEITDFGKKAS